MEPDSSSLREYYRFWIGQQISTATSHILSFVIIWWITITTQSAWYLGLSSALSFGTMMGIQFVAGYITDFYDRKWVIGGVDACQALLTTVLAMLFYLQVETINWVLLILGLRGIFNGLHRPAINAIIPSMVPADKLQQVNSYDSTVSSALSLASPLLAAFLLTIFSSQIWLLLILDAVTFFIALIPLLTITIPIVSHETGDESLKQKFMGGVHFLRKSTGLVPLLLIFASFNFFLTPVSMLTPLIINSERGFSSNELVFAITLSISNIAMLGMSVILARKTPNIPSALGVLLGFSVTISGLILLTMSLLTHQLVLFIASHFIIGLGFPVVNVFSGIIWQSQVPGHVQGRVISVRMIVTTASLPLTMVATGILAEIVPFAHLYLASTFSFVLLLGLIWTLTDFRKIDAMELKQQKTPGTAIAGD